MLSGLFGRKTAEAGPLTRQGLLASDLWLDQPDAAARIAARLGRGEITAEQAEKLRHFVERGYLTFPLDAGERVYREIDERVDRLWREKPSAVAFAYHGPLKLFALADEARDRRPSVRIADLHSVSEAALELYLHRRIFDWVELLFGMPAVATQSLFFEYGSQQTLHRDPIHVYMSPPSHLLAAWVALEEIGPDCGPLTYVPGSHRLPYYQFEKGEHRFDHGRHGEEQIKAALEFDLRQCERRGLRPEPFLCPRGEVLIWHASLLHGGSPPNDPALTRKSFVVHYSTLGNAKRVRQTVLEPAPAGAEPRGRTFGTDRILTRDGCHGFDNPLRGYAGSLATNTAPRNPTS